MTSEEAYPWHQRGPSTCPIAYAGEPGAFAEDAVIAAFGDVRARRRWEAFARCSRPSRRPRAAPAWSPSRTSSTAPSARTTTCSSSTTWIRGEVVVPVRLCLAALPGQRLEDIERVYSHIQALGQAEAFLRAATWQLLTTYNTAGAGKAIADRGERGAAAVLSPRAAALFELEILADDIGDLAGQPDPVPHPCAPGDAAARDSCRKGTARRTTLVVAVRNEPGTLLAVLRVFAEHGLNMHKLESRPSRERAWEYVFWIDLDADTADPATAAAFGELDRVTTMARVLGSYPAAPAT